VTFVVEFLLFLLVRRCGFTFFLYDMSKELYNNNKDPNGGPPSPYDAPGAVNYRSRDISKKKGVKASVVMAEMKKEIEREAMKRAGFVDYDVNLHMDNSNSTDLVAVVPIGGSINSRVGANIKWKSVQVRGIVTVGATPNATCCLMLVYDRKPRGAQPLASDILMTSSPVALLNDANRMRFIVLKRWDFNLGGTVAGASAAYGPSVFMIDEYVKLKGLKAVFNGALDVVGPPILGNGQIGDYTEGAIHLLTLSTVPFNDTNSPTFLGHIRTRFADVQG